MSLSRTTIATAATIAALGILAAVALASGGEEPTTAAPAPAAETDPPVEVRTQVIRRTIHKRPKAATSGARAASSPDDDGTLDQGPGDRPAIPVAPAAAPPAPSSSNRGPGPSGHHGDDDHGRHGDDDDDHFDDHGGDDDSGHGRGRGRGRGGDDD